jgi:hypothetical protein
LTFTSIKVIKVRDIGGDPLAGIIPRFLTFSILIVACLIGSISKVIHFIPLLKVMIVITELFISRFGFIQDP